MGKAELSTVIDKMCLIIYELNLIRPSVLELALPQLEYKLKVRFQVVVFFNIFNNLFEFRVQI
jgi:hypothetical protein